MSATHSTSGGLALLQQKRPEVLGGYLHLLGCLGSELDPKIRELILLALQVVQGSTPGLRHHVPRAFQAGATSADVLDAVLLALPCAGLTRVADALASIEDLLCTPAPAA